MARLRQQFPSNYSSSSNINTELENIIRYVNAAELGDKTLSELLGQLFNSSGEWTGPVEFKYDSTTGLQYRVGTYSNDTEGFIVLATPSAIKGADGGNIGTIGQSIFFDRSDQTATSSQTVFPYANSSTDVLVIYKNGLLQPQSAYTVSAANDNVTFGSALSSGDKVTIYKIRTDEISNFNRTDYAITSTQVQIAYTHTDAETFLVYKNGVLLRSGGSNDYTSSAANNSITFTSNLVNNDLVTVLKVENTSTATATGLMTTSSFVDTDTGLIDFTKLSIQNDEIPQAKVNGLATGLAAKAKLTVSSSTPSNPATGDLFLDTAQTPNQLKFYNGTEFISTNPTSSIPSFTSSNASQVLKVNGTGTALEYGSVDVTALVPKTFMGAASGVASLDSSAKIPTAQIPTTFATHTYPYEKASPSNATFLIKRLWKELIRIDGLTAVVSSGTCTIQLAIDGVAVGTSQAISSTKADVTFGSPVSVDATTSSKRLQVIITNNSSAADLELGVAAVSTISLS
tara:strand:+ start:4384 stop:5925 length:1542 start_codon:yes stop_codon:yes gene_type:complete